MNASRKHHFSIVSESQGKKKIKDRRKFEFSHKNSKSLYKMKSCESIIPLYYLSFLFNEDVVKKWCILKHYKNWRRAVGLGGWGRGMDFEIRYLIPIISLKIECRFYYTFFYAQNIKTPSQISISKADFFPQVIS